MKKYKVYDIHWATDGYDWEMLKLPQEVAITLNAEEDIENCLTDKLSDIFGWLVNSLDYECV